MIARLLQSLPGLALLGALFLAAAPARTEAAPPPPPPASLRFLFLSEQAGAYVLRAENDYRLITSSPYSISPAFKPKDLSPLEIYQQSPAPDPATGKPLYQKIASVVPPADKSAALVIITPRASSAAGETRLAEVELVDNSPSAYAAGAVRVLNRGRVALAARLGSTDLVVEPGSIKVATPAPDARQRLGVRVAVQSPSGWKMIDDNVLMLRPGTRITGLLVFSPSGMRHLYDRDTLLALGEPPPGHAWLTYSDKVQP